MVNSHQGKISSHLFLYSDAVLDTCYIKFYDKKLNEITFWEIPLFAWTSPLSWPWSECVYQIWNSSLSDRLSFDCAMPKSSRLLLLHLYCILCCQKHSLSKMIVQEPVKEKACLNWPLFLVCLILNFKWLNFGRMSYSFYLSVVLYLYNKI